MTAGHDESGYTERLEAISSSGWKRVIGAQAPYRWNIRRVVEGEVLDVGCGIGRNLVHLDGRGVGIDTNPHSVKAARNRGLRAYAAEEFPGCDEAANRYGTLLIAHVLEHMEFEQASRLVGEYLPYIESGGRAVIIVPQEAGFRSDSTHVAPVERDQLIEIAREHGLMVERIYSFPFPRWVGRVFPHNETVALLRLPIA